MPRDQPIAVRSLVAFSQGEIREPMFDLAYDMLDPLGPRISRLNDLEAFLGHIIDNPETKDSCPRPEFDVMAEEYARKLQDVQQRVDERLFAGEAFTKLAKFDKQFIESALGKRPDEIPPETSGAKGPMYLNLAGLYGSSELPSLADSFGSKSEGEVLQQAKSVLKTLELLLDRAKAMTLVLLSYGKDRFWEADGLSHLLDCAEHMALLQGYIHKSRRYGLAITKFMVGKFDRSAARLDCCIRAFIMAYDTLPIGVTPAELDILSRRASCKGKNLDGIYTQYKRDDRVACSFFREYCRVWPLAEARDRVAAWELGVRADALAIRNRLVMSQTLRKRTRRDLCSWNCGRSKALGVDFIKHALAILHVLLRDDINTLKKLVSDLKALCPNQAPARG
ncbi:hypothetical protein NCS57_01159200 [Fusarium keratoplasticum]|uniref:Uncharacterized protein n=1 Tax=Fusarium keratoplasticum TaxID=1328300 RepID=A0ACC0QMU7_9HYPO|nr:hypothetical protein NCS57_01159200 [Fusarium keratoplasticum]KAI8657799.1 hypothetical protein NCS57_01159200 [Fusarium keratoplasticum]